MAGVGAGLFFPEAEVSVLGGMLHGLENARFVLELMDGSEFFLKEHRELFRCIAAVLDKDMDRPRTQEDGLDLLAVLEEMRTQGLEHEIGGLPFLTELLKLSVGPAAANVRYHVPVVIGYKHRREIQAVGRELEWAAEDIERNPNDVIAKAVSGLHAIHPHEGGRAGFPEPLSVESLLGTSGSGDHWIARGLIPAGGNVLVAGYPKTFKTFFQMELAVAAATGTPFLGRFEVERKHRVGLILMEGGAREQARRIERLAQVRGVSPGDLSDSIVVWHRPPLCLGEEGSMRDLGFRVRDLDLDLLVVDAWAYVSNGNSNDADDVVPQLMAFSRLREWRNGLTTALVHHARKTRGVGDGNRLTDQIRNSTAFGGWFDAGLVLSRKTEAPVVQVRVELRDYPSPSPFSFKVQDEIPPDLGGISPPGGFIRLSCVETKTEAAEGGVRAEEILPEVQEYLENHQGISKKALRDGIKRRAKDVDAALALLCDRGIARVEAASKKGQSDRVFTTSSDLVPTSSRTIQEVGSSPPSLPWEGGTGGPALKGKRTAPLVRVSRCLSVPVGRPREPLPPSQPAW